MSAMFWSIDQVNLSFFIVFLVSFSITYVSVPKIISICIEKKLFSIPSYRNFHKEQTPTMGGIAFYLSLIISLFVIHLFYPQKEGISIIAGLSILFFIGVKDDLVNVSPRVKILFQLFALTFLFTNPVFHITSFDGFMAIGEIHFVVSIVLSVFIVLFIINSYNLIDGINGSASMVGIIILSIFTYFFLKSYLLYYAMLSISMIASLLAFLRYNLSKREPVFMGDTGSLVVGFVVSILTLRLLSATSDELSLMEITPISKFVIVLSILFIPFLDTARVVCIRIIEKKKLFLPDRNHIHHVIIDYVQLTHAKASLLLAFVNLGVFLFVYLMSKYLSIIGTTVLFILLSFFMVGLLFYFSGGFSERKKKLKIQKLYQKKK